MMTKIIIHLMIKIVINIGIQTDVALAKDIAIQCSLLPAPPLCFNKSFGLEPEPYTTESDEDATEVDESDTDYMTETSDV